MNSLRLKTIASFVDTEDRVVDIGCDHAYLPIYLVKNKLCKTIIASDINENALNSAKKNIQKEKLDSTIPTILSDGLLNINQKKVDTLVISGMGTSTILHILNKADKKYIKKIILQSNNDLYELRKKVCGFGYYLTDEKIIYEKGHYYAIGMYTLEKRKLNLRKLYFGLYDENNKEYYQSLNEEYKKINKKIGWNHISNKIKILFKMHLLKKYL